jgi:DNA-binding transcriptional regulator YiaG
MGGDQVAYTRIAWKQRIKAAMSPADFKAALEALSWRQADFARHVGCDDKTASRWSVGKSAIPRWVAVHLELLRQIQELQQFLQPKRERKARGSPQ